MRRARVVEAISDKMSAKWPTVETILYGSEARGDARPDSDIDLLILLPEDMNDFNIKDLLFQDLYEIELETGIIINANITMRERWENRPFKTPYYINVTNEGITISPKQ